MDELAGVPPSELIEAAPDGIIVADEEGTILLVNAQLERMFRYRRDELIGRSVEMLLPDEVRRIHAAHRTRYRAEPEPRAMGSGLDLTGRRSDGSVFPTEISLSPVTTAAGLRVVASVRDVTDRVEAEAHRHAVLHTIDSTHDGVFMFDAETLSFSYLNRGACEQLGYEHDELLTMSPIHVCPEFTEATFRERLRPLIDGEVASLMFTTLHRRRDGVDVPVDVVLEYPPEPAPGRGRLLVALVRDISGRREIERARDRGHLLLAAQAEIRARLLEDAPLDRTLELICHHVRRLVDACEVTLVRVGADGSPVRLATEVDSSSDGEGAASPDTGHHLSGEVAARLVELASDGRRHEEAVALGSGANRQGRALALPVAVDGGRGAVLLVARGGGAPFTEEDLDAITGFGGEAGTAMTLAEGRRSTVRLQVLEDRERLARDLHDLVIQRIFAAGIRLQSVQSLIDDPEVGDRVAGAVEQLDQTITELRAAIFRLNNPDTDAVADALTTVVRAATDQLGFEPDLTVNGDPASIPGKIADQLEPILTEALANVARHARATSVGVTLNVLDDMVILRVADDGIGIDPDAAPGNGLRNLAARARELGGSSTVSAGDGRGTTVVWTASFDRP